METGEILKFCLEKGLLLDKELLKLLSETSDIDSAKFIIEKIRSYTNKRVITKELFIENRERANKIFLDMPLVNQKNLEKLKINLGLSIEISREVLKTIEMPKEAEVDLDFKVLSNFSSISKKLEVKDFVSYFRARFNEMRGILQERFNSDNLISINKISGSNSTITIIGMVINKTVTKNKNIILEIEDLTGKIKVLINKNKEELYTKAEEISLDSVLGFKGSGNKEILFANDIIFPDAFLLERKYSPTEEYMVFLGDLHFGSKRFLEKSFLKFIDYINGNIPDTPEVDKIKYLFIVGDLITGIGNYPNQEKDLLIFDLEEQFTGIAELLKRIRKDIKIIICPGNHDGVRLMEPQPFFDEKYAWPLYEMKNVFLINNPSFVNVGIKKGFTGFNILAYHGFSFPYYAGAVPYLIKAKAMNSPELILSYLLKNRHLAPTHASAQYFPSDTDFHLIKEVPDIFIAGHTHKSGVSYYNNVLCVSVSSWEGMTPYQEKFGNTPDHCKVPLFNTKTRAIKILDFEEK